MTLDFTHFLEPQEVRENFESIKEEKIKSINDGDVVKIDALSVSEIVLLNPISSILKYNVKSLYNHPLIKQYVILKGRGLMRFIILLLKLLIYIIFVMSLTMVGFSTQKPWQLTKDNQSWTTHDVCANYTAERNVSKVKNIESTLNAAICRCNAWWYVALITLGSVEKKLNNVIFNGTDETLRNWNLPSSFFANLTQHHLLE